MKKCQFCGSELPDEASFCLKCSSVINTREVSDSNKKKILFTYKYKKAFSVLLVFIFAFSLCFLSASRVKRLPSVPDDSTEPKTTLIPVTLPNGEEVTDELGNSVYEPSTVEGTTKKPSFISEIINSIKDKDKDKDENKDKNDNNVSNSGSDISQKPSSNEKDTTSSSKEPSTDNNNVTSPTQSQAPTETEPTTEEEIIKENPAEVFEYEPYQKSTTRISITKYKGNASFVTIPDFIGELMVVEIQQDAFKDNSKIKTIDIIKGKRSFISLRSQCFNNLSSLTTVNLYENDLGIYGDFAVDCPIKDFNIDFWQYKVADGAIYSCDPGYWQFRTFLGNPCYTTLTLPSWCKAISQDNNLDTAKNLKIINAHKGITYMPMYDYDYNQNLQAINVESGNDLYMSKDGVFFGKYAHRSDSTNYVGFYPYSKKDKTFTFPQKEGYTFKITCFSYQIINPYVEELYIPINSYLGWNMNSKAFPNLKKIHFAKGHPSYEEIRYEFAGETDFY